MRTTSISATYAAAIIATILIFSSILESQAAEPQPNIVGTWKLASAKLSRDGIETDFYGKDPNGILIFDASGNYSLIVIQSNPPPPRFVSGKRDEGEPYEYKYTVHRSIANVGTYELDTTDKLYKSVLVLRIKASTFANWDGITQRRPCNLSSSTQDGLDQLEYHVQEASAGGRAQFVWERKREE